MNFVSLEIEGAYKISPSLKQDARGGFARVFCSKTFENQGLCCEWNQMNVSRNLLTGTVRGLHFQRPPFCEVKLVRCVRGKVYDVILDLRSGSATYGRTCEVILNGEAMDMVYIPKGCAHGFQTLTGDAELHYCHSQPYSPDSEGGILPVDPNLSIAWPLDVTLLSERDRNHPKFETIEPISL